MNGLATYTFPGGTPTIHLPTGANPVMLATESGPFSGSLNQAIISGGVPTANVDTLWTDVFNGGFFLKPPFGVVLDLEQGFTNTPGVITKTGPGCSTTGTDCTYEIHGGGGNGDFLLVPEPASLAVFGVGLVAMGLIRRRRA